MFLASITLATTAAAAPAIDQSKADSSIRIERVTQARATLSTCFRDNLVSLGARNAESADTLLRAARSMCEPADRELQASYDGIYAPRYLMERGLREDRASAENAATAALLEARTH